MAVTGVTHFNKVSGKTGVYSGIAGAEVQIDVGNVQFTTNLAAQTTAADGAYFVMPFAVNLVAANAAICSGTTGTGASFTITLTDTAGANLWGTASFASAGTAGSAVVAFGTMSTAQIAAAGVICVTKASCATAYGATIVITCTKANAA